MKILIQTEVLPAPFHWDPRCPRRGTERFYVETAKALAENGHEVQVVYDGAYLERDNVQYQKRDFLAEPGEFDAILKCNQRGPFRGSEMDPPRGETRVVWWTNFADFRLQQLTFRDADAAVVISNYAASIVGDAGGDSPPLYVVPHGVDKTFWTPGSSGLRDQYRICLYTSSPDRGGGWLREVFESLDTDYELICSPYPGWGEPFTEEQLRERYRIARYWLHPGMGTELFCLSAAEAQACGCVPIINPTGALAETVRWGHRFPSDKYLEGLAATLRGDYVGGANADHLLDWKQATALLEEVLCE